MCGVPQPGSATSSVMITKDVFERVIHTIFS